MTPKVLVVVRDGDLAELLGADRSQRKGMRRRNRGLRRIASTADKGASTGIAGASSNTAAPKVRPNCARRSREHARAGQRCARSFWVRSYDLRSRSLGRAAPLVAHQQGHYNAR
jgi:hypothetical protein